MESGHQLRMDIGAVATPVGKPFTIVHRPGYGVIEELLEANAWSNDVGFLQYAILGLASSEIAPNLTRPHWLGIPSDLLMGMREAEILTMYSELGKAKFRFAYLKELSEMNVPAAVSKMVSNGFGRNARLIRALNSNASDHGYNTAPGGLVGRMQHILHENPGYEHEFRDSALSTITVDADAKTHIFRLGLDAAIEYAASSFSAKEQLLHRSNHK